MTIFLPIFITTISTLALSAELNEGRIVYSKRENGQSNIYLLDLKSKESTSIFKNKNEPNLNSLFPKWAKNGQSIEFAAMKNEKWTSFEFDLKDNQLTQLNRNTLLISTDSYSIYLSIKKGELYYRKPGDREKKLYSCPIYSKKLNPCASEASLIQQGQWAIFQSCGFSFFSEENCNIKAAHIRTGIILDYGKGRQPQWIP